MLKLLKRIFLQPQTKQKNEIGDAMYHFILLYKNENGYSCTFRTYAPTYKAAKGQLLREYAGKKISDVSLKSKNLQ